MPGKKLLIITAALAALALSLALTPVSPYAVGKAFSEDAQPPPASNQPAGTPAGAPQPATPPAAVTILNDHEVEGILGREVVSSAGENMGRVVDVLVDRSGQVRAAIIDFGGFLGVGSRKIVVDWNALHFGRVAEKGDSITLELTKAQVAAAPEFKEDTPIVVLGAAGNLQPLDDH